MRAPNVHVATHAGFEFDDKAGGIAEVIEHFINRRVAEINIEVAGAVRARLHGRSVGGGVPAGLEHLRLLAGAAPVKAALSAVLKTIIVVIIIIWIGGLPLLILWSALPLLNLRSDLALLQRLAIRIHGRSAIHVGVRIHRTGVHRHRHDDNVRGWSGTTAVLVGAILVEAVLVRAIVLGHLLAVIGILSAGDREQRQGCHAREGFHT